MPVTDTLLRDAILLSIGGVLAWEGLKWVARRVIATAFAWAFRNYLKPTMSKSENAHFL